jgi:hypothetical protein
MTAVLTVTCDHCGERIEADRTVLRVETGPARDRLPTVDLCPGCLERFTAWLAGNSRTERGVRSADADPPE